MDDTGLPQIPNELPELSALSTEDIPVAVRHGVERASQSSGPQKPLLLMLGGAIALVLVVVPLLMAVRSQAPSRSTSEATDAAPTSAPSPASPSPDPSVLGHRAYSEAPANELVGLSQYPSIKMRQAAAKKLEEMIQAADEEGVALVPLSGFRSEAEQSELFFGVKAARGQQATTRAALSAPPGYSEHHTGYAIDLGDGDRSSADLELEFENTKAFKWLQTHAAHYSFEMSFPKNNSMGLSYEPWHWRFVGDRQSLETFYRSDETEASRQAPAATSSAGTEAKTDAVQ